MKLIKHDWFVIAAFVFNMLAGIITRFIVVNITNGINCEANISMKTVLEQQSAFLVFLLYGIGWALIIATYLHIRKKYIADPTDKNEFSLTLQTSILFFFTLLDLANDVPYYIFILVN